MADKSEHKSKSKDNDTKSAVSTRKHRTSAKAPSNDIEVQDPPPAKQESPSGSAKAQDTVSEGQLSSVMDSLHSFGEKLSGSFNKVAETLENMCQHGQNEH